jgi:hypothetical protein
MARQNPRYPIRSASSPFNSLISSASRSACFAISLPAAHPLRRQLNHKNRRGQAGRFCVEENPSCFVHASKSGFV